MEMIVIAALGFFATGYLVLGGADIGVGMLLPFLGRDHAERRVVIASIAPFFLGNEVWLIATVGVLIGGFPILDGVLLTGMLPVIVLLIAGWVTRDMGLWLRGRENNRVWWALCDGAIVLGSWAVAASWGWLFAGVFTGTLDRFAVGAGAVLVTLGITVVFAVHGLAFAALRCTGILRSRARRLSGEAGEARTFLLTSAVLAAITITAGLRLPLSDSAADGATLAVLAPVLLLLIPILAAIQGGVWWLFRHRVTGPSYL
ncbi:cytochrome d ubiquinol oxidase subunit II [Actinoalloteichus hymeniacidonis]|uniref:Cytochrome bd-type quinol oxidase, subunit 2 n=1 Tax=Actinoalloteichus hymeniacidonis TaxID=340345 RepID=A0AAC9HSU2_9PSEU|nr:cytochrome d ubiquinol oxidase subunit II [Actinoalloteichus hymeniacidonis]AOS64833.1 cytochrome bd-type quinol oxidase, subunit 2 [Actinoalloteichus hymeniacidonis]MBB5907092.1 cytochrome bd-type quinol oxidase subunit 2 [Actinoalloteichus hymeniacidonis]